MTRAGGFVDDGAAEIYIAGGVGVGGGGLIGGLRGILGGAVKGTRGEFVAVEFADLAGEDAGQGFGGDFAAQAGEFAAFAAPGGGHGFVGVILDLGLRGVVAGSTAGAADGAHGDRGGGV